MDQMPIRNRFFGAANEGGVLRKCPFFSPLSYQTVSLRPVYHLACECHS